MDTSSPSVEKLLSHPPAETIEEAFDAVEMLRQGIYEGMITTRE